MSFMFKWDELDELKKHSLDDADNSANTLEGRQLAATLVTIYQNEQILRELKSIGWKLKEINDRGVL
jgi:hypothetical protein